MRKPQSQARTLELIELEKSNLMNLIMITLKAEAGTRGDEKKFLRRIARHEHLKTVVARRKREGGPKVLRH